MTEQEKDPVQEYLDKIGPRPLTHDEARELEIIRIRAGKSQGMSDYVEKLAAEAKAAKEKEKGG